MIGYVCINDKKDYIGSIFKINSIKYIKIRDNEFCIFINDKEIKKEKDNKYFKKVVGKLERKGFNSLILEEKIKKEKMYLYNELINSSIKIIDGYHAYEELVYNIIEYILLHNTKIKLEELNIGILIDLMSYNRLKFIKKMSEKVKGITILTNTKSKFDNIANEILENTGLSLKVSNNYRSGLKNCNLIVNFDIDNNKIFESCNNNCIIVNCTNPIQKVRKNFRGIIINDVVVEIEEQEVFNYINKNHFRNIALAQSFNENTSNYNIEALIGIKGIICNKEFENFYIKK